MSGLLLLNLPGASTKILFIIIRKILCRQPSEIKSTRCSTWNLILPDMKEKMMAIIKKNFQENPSNCLDNFYQLYLPFSINWTLVAFFFYRKYISEHHHAYPWKSRVKKYKAFTFCMAVSHTLWFFSVLVVSFVSFSQKKSHFCLLFLINFRHFLVNFFVMRDVTSNNASDWFYMVTVISSIVRTHCRNDREKSR